MKLYEIFEDIEDDEDDDITYTHQPVPWSPPTDFSDEMSDHFNKIWPEIVSNCRNALIAMKHADIKAKRMFLYRGVRSNPGMIAKLRSREDRKPLSTRKNKHEFIDNWMKEHGLKATRSNSIFASSSYLTARSYATATKTTHDPAVMLIIPCDNANITWSPKIEDMYNDMPNSDEGKMITFLENSDFKSDDLCGALCSKNELMINGEYWALDTRYMVMIREKLNEIN